MAVFGVPIISGDQEVEGNLLGDDPLLVVGVTGENDGSLCPRGKNIY
jgi:hypothetical protein